MGEASTSVILVVDDEPSIRMALRDFLQFSGYTVHEAESGVEALSCLESCDVDLVLTDIMMPGMKGTELMVEVHRTDPYMPFVLVTAYPSIDAAVQCMRTGAIDYIGKPFQLGQIESAVTAGISKRHELMKLSASTATRDRRIPREYQCLRTLGQGSMGVVFLVSPKDSEQRFALKSLHLTGNSYDDHRLAVRRFGQEIRAAKMVDHPNIVKVVDYGSTRDFLLPYVVMEYVPGHPLSFLIDHEALDLPTKLRILRQVADAVKAIHQMGILHRDIKPTNILMDADLNPKLGDFGIATLPGMGAASTEGIAGSPSYMSPEAFDSTIDARSDIYSFGATAFELLEDRRLHAHDTTAQVMASIVHGPQVDRAAFSKAPPEPLLQVVLKCLCKDPADRYQTADELCEALQAV